MNPRYRHRIRACLFLGVGIALCCPTTASAQKKKPAVESKAEAEGTLPDLDFDAPRDPSESESPVVMDKDETPEGRDRLKEIERRARTIFQDRDDVMEQRRPLALERDTELGKAQIAENERLAAVNQYNALEKNAVELQRQISFAGPATIDRLKAQLRNVQGQMVNCEATARGRKAYIESLAPGINALNIQIAPFDARLQKLWQELNEARKQWLELRQPMEKYARGEFEALRGVLDEWLLIDGLWPSAFAWAALCSYEMEEIDKAFDYLEKARNSPSDVWTKSTVAQLGALTGLVTAKMPGQASKSSREISRAITKVDKKSGWETYFLVGRYYVEREHNASRAKAHLESALKIRPNCLCAKLWLARLQTTSKDPKVRDLAGGTKSLEYLWEHTGKRSWRLAFFLFDAYQQGKRTSEANQMWEIALRLAPADQHEQLKKDRDEILKMS